MIMIGVVIDTTNVLMCSVQQVETEFNLSNQGSRSTRNMLPSRSTAFTINIQCSLHTVVVLICILLKAA